jgi:signal transduction histidine kinase
VVEHRDPRFADVFVVDDARLLPALSMIALFTVVGLGVGYLSRLQRSAEHQLAEARAHDEAVRAREEVARTLHDGVLQTLALVQRQSPDPELARLAAQTDRDLRRYLAGTANAASPRLKDALRVACDTFTAHFGITPQVVVDDLLDNMSPTTIDALAAATGEALANIGKHANASHIVVYAGRTDPRGTIVTINDDGVGFDPSHTPSDRGIVKSVRKRMHDVGGTVDIRSTPHDGSQVRLWVP